MTLSWIQLCGFSKVEAEEAEEILWGTWVPSYIMLHHFVIKWNEEGETSHVKLGDPESSKSIGESMTWFLKKDSQMHKAGESFLIKYQLVVALQQEVQTAGKTSAPVCTDMEYLQKTA